MNINAVLAQTQAFLNSDAGRKLVAKAARNGMPADVVNDAANDLAQHVTNSIPSSLSGGIGAKTTVDFGDDGIATITLVITGVLYRPSLYQEKYGGVDNIVSLFSKGWSYSKKGPRGYWHGTMTNALRNRVADPFVARAVNEWESTWSGKLEILSVEINTAYT